MRTWVAVWLALISSVAGAADVYPSRPIRIIILVVPGGGADITSRAVGQKLTEAWGQQAIVDNRPGGNGIVGMEIAKNANPTACQRRDLSLHAADAGSVRGLHPVGNQEVREGRERCWREDGLEAKCTAREPEFPFLHMTSAGAHDP